MSTPMVLLPVGVVVLVYGLLGADLLRLQLRLRRLRREDEARKRARAAHPSSGPGRSTLPL